MKLLTPEIRAQLPPLYGTEGSPDPIAQAKFFRPDSNWTWYVIEFDGEDTCFGLVQGYFEELGYFSLSELESIRGPNGAAVERDLGFKPTPLSNVEKS